jgi:hypothetical protein
MTKTTSRLVADGLKTALCVDLAMYVGFPLAGVSRFAGKQSVRLRLRSLIRPISVEDYLPQRKQTVFLWSADSLTHW